MSAFTPTSVYLVDSKPGRSASAVAINNCVRSIVGAITTIFSSQCVDAVGPGILFTILAAINFVNAITVLIVMVRGKKWRTDFEKRTGTGPVTANDDSNSDTADEQKEAVPAGENMINEKPKEYDSELAIVRSRMSQV